jgi:hypothetical protein
MEFSMNVHKNNEVIEILKELTNLERKRVNVTQNTKYLWHKASNVEPVMSNEDYTALLRDVSLIGIIHTPVILYNGKILDGRHRQKVAIELNLSLPVKELKGNYSIEALEEFVRSIHMGRNKSKVQKEIQAFKYKKEIAGVTYTLAAERYGVSERNLKKIISLFNLLRDNGYSRDFDIVISTLEIGRNITPDQFEWVSRTTGSISGLISQFKLFIQEKRDKENRKEFDPTEYEEVVNSDTGEVVIKEVKKKKKCISI